MRTGSAKPDQCKTPREIEQPRPVTPGGADLRAHPRCSWRWRELNPRPTLLREGFSGRSPRRPYSASPVMRTCWCDRPSRCLLSLEIPRPDLSVILLADVRFGAEKDPVQRIPYSLRRRGRNLAQLVCWHLFFCNGWLTRSSLPSSARFTSLDRRCRDRSPPRGLAVPPP